MEESIKQRCSIQGIGKNTRPSRRSAIVEESLRMVIFRQFHSVGTPEKLQTYLLLRKFFGLFHTVTMGLGLQINVQKHIQLLQLVGQEFMA